ncbi:hypothetical protein DXT99_13850 [Pontibacter diazotrophicus]|uniref:Uncharacterized protein n=1 Tax=Pontibacter diazotrophicus TaxID=1400979 RepID=A0A3D8LAY3_9BACT|nr:hypothetical protein DXT99_13850 [Pontibacter diazotrophicus]
MPKQKTIHNQQLILFTQLYNVQNRAMSVRKCTLHLLIKNGSYSESAYCNNGIIVVYFAKSMFKFRFWMRKLSMKGSGETVLELHSSAMEREKCIVRFLYGQFAAQRMNSKHALI